MLINTDSVKMLFAGKCCWVYQTPSWVENHKIKTNGWKICITMEEDAVLKTPKCLYADTILRYLLFLRSCFKTCIYINTNLPIMLSILYTYQAINLSWFN